MLKITVTTYDSPCSIQDYFPPPGIVVNFEPNTTKSFDVQWDQLERLASQLRSLEALNFLTFIVEGTSGMSLTEQADSPGNPSIDYAEPGIITAAVDALLVTGNNLLAGQVVADAAIPGDTVAGQVLLTTVIPGGQGNRYDVEVIDTAGGGLSVSTATVVDREVITVDLGGSAGETVTTVTAIINNAASDTYGVVHAVADGVGATAIATVKTLTAFTGGVGTGMQITLAGLPCIVISIDDTAAPIIALSLATPVLTALSLATDDMLKLELRADGKLTDLTLRHA